MSLYFHLQGSAIMRLPPVMLMLILPGYLIAFVWTIPISSLDGRRRWLLVVTQVDVVRPIFIVLIWLDSVISQGGLLYCHFADRALNKLWQAFRLWICALRNL